MTTLKKVKLKKRTKKQLKQMLEDQQKISQSLHADLVELTNNPNSEKSTSIRYRVAFIDSMQKEIMAGSHLATIVITEDVSYTIDKKIGHATH
jgi:hypothetical protein